MTQRRDLQALIDAAPVGKMQWRVIICCFLVVMLDGFDTAAIGFIAPDIRTHWQLTAGDLAPLFGAGLLGLTAGALLCGPLSDRFGRKRVIELCVFLFGALSLASAFSPDLQTLVFLRFLTGLGLGGAMPNTITMTSEYLPARRRGALVPVMGWHGILVLGGVLPLMLFVVLLVTLPESPRWQVRRQLPQSVIAKTVSAITCERYADTHFYLNESATIAKGSIRQLFMGRQLPVTLMLWVVFFMSLLIIYLLSSWMPTLLNHRGIDLQHASWITAAFQIGGTLGALALGVLMDKFNPFRVLALSYAIGAVCIVMIGLSQDGLWLMALAIFGTGIGISGSQVGLNALTATLYPTQSRATGVSWSNAVGRCGAIVGSLSGGVMMAMNFSFDTLFFIIAVPAAISAVMLTLLITVVRQSTSVPDSLPRAGVVNE
ncbi:TPA: aromatic acid/H+ symport family MFS transporter [Escherichia albertii]|uniref:3-hydroxybenzoate transporter MhbT n=1 Tax=Escherichia albertii TaxID=208962 RepID=UPI0010F7986D|nr:aromatic acid/H+ symport family MFS transporter [Escherichia albertii]WMV68287.1 aromatic acid/H+ symport family MFS transporter [Escherichia albertii]HEB1084932.1 aromatic acid/H+ symport family MFS transporter [Escherichia albertii]HEB1101968.1 aromatic acid/H+ symport family MFS transporter [Escherichia albertii]HEB1106641.1 aromatic acid/H+ symport family MFS transporter [Escherichia albertii]HEB1183246.1 aromatic acid/H+ symport family MFS transporter [Escherichia albertii]